MVLDEAPGSLQVGLDHLLNKAVEIDLALPPQEPFSFRGIAKEQTARFELKSESEIKSKRQI